MIRCEFCEAPIELPLPGWENACLRCAYEGAAEIERTERRYGAPRGAEGVEVSTFSPDGSRPRCARCEDVIRPHEEGAEVYAPTRPTEDSRVVHVMCMAPDEEIA